MKKLNKFQIDSEKLMKNEELIALRGGYGAGNCCCRVCNTQTFTICGAAGSADECKYMCSPQCYTFFG